MPTEEEKEYNRKRANASHEAIRRLKLKHMESWEEIITEELFKIGIGRRHNSYTLIEEIKRLQEENRKLKELSE